jgi:hypothetical protein
MGSRGFHLMDKSVLAIHPVALGFRAAVLLLSIAGLLQFRIPPLPLVLLPPAHSGFALVEVDQGAASKVESMIVPCPIAIPFALSWALSTS